MIHEAGIHNVRFFAFTIRNASFFYCISPTHLSEEPERLGDVSYYPIVITSIDILFQYSDTFKKIGFPRVIDAFIQSNAKLNENGREWDISPMADFNSYIMTNYKRNKNERDWFDGFMKEITAIVDKGIVSDL